MSLLYFGWPHLLCIMYIVTHEFPLVHSSLLSQHILGKVRRGLALLVSEEGVVMICA